MFNAFGLNDDVECIWFDLSGVAVFQTFQQFSLKGAEEGTIPVPKPECMPCVRTSTFKKALSTPRKEVVFHN